VVPAEAEAAAIRVVQPRHIRTAAAAAAVDDKDVVVVAFVAGVSARRRLGRSEERSIVDWNAAVELGDRERDCLAESLTQEARPVRKSLGCRRTVVEMR